MKNYDESLGWKPEQGLQSREQDTEILLHRLRKRADEGHEWLSYAILKPTGSVSILHPAKLQTDFYQAFIPFETKNTRIDEVSLVELIGALDNVSSFPRHINSGLVDLRAIMGEMDLGIRPLVTDAQGHIVEINGVKMSKLINEMSTQGIGSYRDSLSRYGQPHLADPWVRSSREWDDSWWQAYGSARFYIADKMIKDLNKTPIGAEIYKHIYNGQYSIRLVTERGEQKVQSVSDTTMRHSNTGEKSIKTDTIQRNLTEKITSLPARRQHEKRRRFKI